MVNVLLHNIRQGATKMEMEMETDLVVVGGVHIGGKR